MNKLSLGILLSLVLAASFILSAQNNQTNPSDDPTGEPAWIDLMRDHSVNFYTVQKAFNEYFHDRPTGKGTGWKQFKRWEYYMEPRVFPSGNRANQAQVWNEIMKFREKYPRDNSAYRSNWEPLGPDTWTNITGHWNPGIGRINVIARDPYDPLTIYIGAPSGGLWKTTDEGETWEVLTDDLPVMGVSGIAIHPLNPDIIYIGTGDRDADDNYSIGVLKSTDGGQTWDVTGLEFDINDSRTIAKLLINPVNPNILFAATTNGLYKTTNSGQSWYVVQNGNIDDIEFKPGNPNTVYAVTKNFYRSTNGGESFTQTSGLPNNNRVQIAVTDANPEYVYLFSYENGIYRSTNSGVSFTQRSDSPTEGSQGWYDLAMAASPLNAEEVHIGEINTYRSLNGGQTWTQTTNWTWGNNLGYTHCDIHELVFYGNTLYVGSDGLICKSTDNGDNFTDLTTGVSIRQFYRIAGSKTNPYKLMGGSQDNGTSVYTNDYWHEWLGADGMECAIDHTNENIVYGTSQNGTFYKSTNGGNGGNVGITQPGGGAWVTPFVMHPTDPQTLYVGLSNVRKTTNGMMSWTTISDLGTGNIRNMYISESDPNYLYVSKSETIYRTTDGGSTWENVTSGLPANFISYIAVHPLYPETVAVSLSGYDDGQKVFISYDAGDTWENYSGNLPNIPANCVIFNIDEALGIYVGMDVGIYYRDNTLPDWEPFNDGLPNVIVTEMEIHHEIGKIRAGTYGRGLWEADLHPTIPPDITMTYTVHAEGDDFIEFGETVTLDVQIKNNNDTAAENVEMTIAFMSQYLNLTDTSEFFGTINPGDSTLIENAFSFEVAPDVPDNFLIDLATLITSDLNSWEGSIKLRAYAPVIEIGAVDVIDGNNGYLEPGESAQVQVEFVNNGSLTANDINITISSIDPFVTLTNTSATIDILEPLNSQTIAFNISVADNSPVEHIILVNFDLLAADDYSANESVGLVIGQIMEDFETGNYTKYPWEFSGDANWVIDNAEVYEGAFSGRSGSIPDNSESILQIELDIVGNGEISFYRKVSCEDDPGGTSYDYLTFRIDDQQMGIWDGETPWGQETYAISEGLHTLTWIYHKDPYVNAGSDCAWVDNIVFPSFDNGIPQLFVSPSSFSDTLMPEQTDTDTLYIYNIGGGTLEYNLVIVEAKYGSPADLVTWLSANVDSGSLSLGDMQAVELTYNSSDLEEGEYQCVVVISDTSGNQFDIPVTLTIVSGVGIDESIDLENPVMVYPNPFTNETTLTFIASEKAELKLEVFDYQGERIKTLINNQVTSIGANRYTWNGTDDNQVKVPSGIYFYTLDAGKQYTGKMILIR